MRVLQLNNNHRIVGGSDRVYLNTGKVLEQAGHQVSYFAAKSDNDEPCKDSNYFCSSLDTKTATAKDAIKFLRNNDASTSLTQLLSSHNTFDVAHLHIYYGRLTPSVLGPLRKRNLPIIQTLHEYKLVCPVYTMERNGSVCTKCITGSSLNCIIHRCKTGSPAKSALIWLEHALASLQGSIRSIDQFICVSEFQKRIFIEGGVPENKLKTVYNMVDGEALQPKRQIERGNYHLYYGRIETIKGLNTLLKAAQISGVPLKIAGSGSWSDVLIERIRKLPNVDYLGFVGGEPLKELVAGAKAVIVPSEWYETFGLTAAEAKAVGTPVIAAKIGGLQEVVQDNVDGFLFEPGNVDALVEALDRLNKANTEEMGAAGKLDVAQRFSAEAYLSNLMQIYESALR